jgi:vacuolar-type H+-ATPase subunit C/Vma6
MDDLLKFECDMRTINVIHNSFAVNDLNNPRGKEASRAKYLTELGYLYPDFMAELNKAQDSKALVEALDGTNYKPMLAAANLD